MNIENINELINKNFKNLAALYILKNEEISIEVNKSIIIDICKALKEDKRFLFNALMDISGVDYLDYKKNYWETKKSTSLGFSRGYKENTEHDIYMKNRFCISYHLLSYTYNYRIRIKTFVSLEDMVIPSVCTLWSTADWHERETYDLFGIIFKGHTNLIKILTDYGFEGFPLRKDFPLTGEYEIRYDENKEKITREYSNIKRTINTPKIIREYSNHK